jgi:hypothetical protein
MEDVLLWKTQRWHQIDLDFSAHVLKFDPFNKLRPSQLTPWSLSFSRGRQLYNYSIRSQYFMEPDGSLPRSHELSTSS